MYCVSHVCVCERVLVCLCGFEREREIVGPCEFVCAGVRAFEYQCACALMCVRG